MNIESELKKLEASIDEQVIDVHDEDILRIPIKLFFYELEGYTKLFAKLNRVRNSSKTYREKERLKIINKYIFKHGKCIIEF